MDEQQKIEKIVFGLMAAWTEFYILLQKLKGRPEITKSVEESMDFIKDATDYLQEKLEPINL